MQLKRTALSILVGSCTLLSLSPVLLANEVSGDKSKFKLGKAEQTQAKKSKLYIVQLAGKTSIEKAAELGELAPQNQMVKQRGNRYNANSAKLAAYQRQLEAKQQQVTQSVSDLKINYSFKHTFNGFSAVLTAKQKQALETNNDVVAIWEDRLQQLTTANTPKFLGLSEPGGQHALNVLGEDVVIGVVDTGIWPEHPSFAGEGYAPLPGWSGICDVGEDESFSCNNKLIGARYFKESFESTYTIQVALGEFISPRDADGHGSHTAGTAGGNVVENAMVNGFNAGTISGIAPRARIAAYKACWNSSYVSPEGNRERGCFYGDTMAAIDQAVADGVDVINYSIGGSLTDLTTPPAAAMLSAAEAGVFVAVSAGNSGPDAQTIGTPAPWVTSVAASTYDGVVPSRAIEATVDGVTNTHLAVEGAINKSINDIGSIDESLVVAQPLLGCFIDDDEDGDKDDPTPLDNAAEMNGNIALISRGGCAFVEKVERALLSGAKGVLVYTNNDAPPFPMGGEETFDLAAFMIGKADGESLKAALDSGETVSVKMAPSISAEATIVGNLMAGFSSRGPNLSTEDILKPDITAPGVQILAATSAAPMFDAPNQQNAYLQGTSMSSPHIAGMAALFKESNPNWSPAQIKSALMTSARQDVTLDGTTPALPFDFGAGHAAPVSAMTPGLLFDLNINNYLGFMCGLDESVFVEARGVTCGALAAAGFSAIASELNLASIAVGELVTPRTVNRFVTNATSVASTYQVSVEAPEGIDVAVSTFDDTGALTAADTLDVAANGNAGFSVTLSANEQVKFDEWVFGAITWQDGQGHVVRLPLAVKAKKPKTIVVPEVISSPLSRGRLSFPVKMKYTGAVSLDYVGLAPPNGNAGTVEQDPNSSFSFNEDGLGTHFFHVEPGTQVARFSLSDSLVDQADSDLDLYVYRCIGWDCKKVGESFNKGSNETVILVNPEPANNIGVGNVYLVWTHGLSIGDGAPSTGYVMPVWIVDRAERNTRISTSRRAINERYNNISVRTKGLTSGLIHMGAVTFYNDKNEAEGTTVLEVVPD